MSYPNEDYNEKIVRNQIDYVMVNERYRNSIRSVKAYPGVDVSSDHNPLIARIHIKLKRPSKRIETDHIDTNRLKDPKIKEDLKRHINDNLRMLSAKTQNTNVEDKWQDLKEAIMKPASILTREKQKKDKTG